MSDTNKQVGATPPSRRDFMKTSAVAVVGGAVVGNLSVAQSAHAGGSDVIRIGLIGCGGRGAGAVKDAFKSKAYVRLVAMGDAFRDRLEEHLGKLKNDDELKEFQDRIDVPEERRFDGFEAYQKVIDSGVDLVILATPPGFRPIHLKAAIAAGKHVFMEKPVAVDAPGVRSVIESAAAAKKKGLAVGVGLQRRHRPGYIETIKRLQDGAVGDIVSTRVYWNGGGVWDPRKRRDECKTEMEYQMRNWYYYTWLCGDHIVEQHIHNLDVINWLKDAYPVRANGMGGREVRVDKKYGEIFDHHNVEFEYADGSRMYSQCRHIPGCWDEVSEYAQGTNGTADIWKYTIRPKGKDGWRYRGANPNPYEVEHADLYASIHNGSPNNEAEYGAYSSMTAILGRMATYSGKTVTWDEAIKTEHKLAPTAYAWDANPPVMPKPDGSYPIAVPGQTKVV